MNKPTFKSTRLRAAALALTLSAALGQALLAPADAFAASEPIPMAIFFRSFISA